MLDLYSGKKESKRFTEINITPFVEVVLVLLIIFMVTTPMLDKGIELKLPTVKSGNIKQDKSEQPVVMSIDEKKQLYINNNTIPLNGLSERLRLIYRKKKNKGIFIKADKSVNYGFVAKVISKVKGAGIDKIALVTEDLIEQNKE